MTAVVDTSVLIGGLMSPRSASGKLIDALLDGDFHIAASKEIIGEFRYISSRIPPLKRPAKRRRLDRILELMEESAPEMPEIPRVKISSDPDDDKFIAAALAVKADALVSADKRDLLSLDGRIGIPIIAAHKFLRMLKGG